MVDLTQFIETAPIWVQLAGTPPQGKRLEGTHLADLVVVGAGIAGLSAAYYVARLMPSMTVIVVDAAHLGTGTTGRSTGIVTPGMKIPIKRARRTYGDAGARAALRASFEGVDQIRELIDTEAIDCDARDEPHLRVALTAAHTRTITQRIHDLRSLGFDFDLLAGAELTSKVGDRYVSGQHFDTALLIDPYRFTLGLADAARRRGVEIFEHSRVTAVESTGDVVTVDTDAGQIIAAKALLATNGSAGSLHPHPDSVFTVRGQALATIPLTTEQIDSLEWDGRGAIIDERHFFNHYRLTTDRRLLFGGGPLSVSTGRPARDCLDIATGFHRLQQQLSVTFPTLRDVPIAARWTADEAASLDRLPVVGPVPDRGGVYYAGSWNGHGLSTATAAAWRFARTLHGAATGPVPWQRAAAPRLPIRRGRRPVLRAYLRLLDRLDSRDTPRPRPAADAVVGGGHG